LLLTEVFTLYRQDKGEKIQFSAFQRQRSDADMKHRIRTRNKPKYSFLSSLSLKIILCVSKSMFMLETWEREQNFQ